MAAARASFTSGDQTITAVNDGVMFGRGGAGIDHYGNWPRGGTQWVEYTWSKPISTNKADVLWFQDGGGLRYPKASRLKFWDENTKAFADVPNAKGLGVANGFNTTTFDEVTTTRIRLEIVTPTRGMARQTSYRHYGIPRL